MRINEFASAEEQLALWKLISDNIWISIKQQASIERQQRLEKLAQDKLKPKIRGDRVMRKSFTPTQQIKTPPPLKKSLPFQQKPIPPIQTSPKITGPRKNSISKPTNLQVTNPLPKQQRTVGIAQQQRKFANPQSTNLQQQAPLQQLLIPNQNRQNHQNIALLTKNNAVSKRI